MKAYCMRCKKQVEMENPVEMTMKNGKKAMQGFCPHCATKVFRIVG